LLSAPHYLYISVDIYCLLVRIVQKQLMMFKRDVLRFPTLDTVLMIENEAEKSKGDYTVTQLWKRLPRKVMWQTYLTTLDYLEYSNKIVIDREKYVIWIWAPEDIAKMRKKGLLVEP